jgi:hypothetical protein
MNNDIMGNGGGVSRWEDRSVARAQRGVVSEVRLAGLKARGALALSSYIAEAVVEVDEERRALARRSGPELNAVLIEIEVTGIEQAQKVQRGLYKNIKF